MTIHHDKLAYGKLASNREDLSEEKIALMLKALKEDAEEGKPLSDREERAEKKESND